MGTFDEDTTITSLPIIEEVNTNTEPVDTDEDIHNVMTEQVIDENDSTTENMDEIRDDSTTTPTTTSTVVIPSMLPTQNLLDQLYDNEKHTTMNKSLKMTKINKAIHKRKPENISQETVPIISNKTSTKKKCSKNAKKTKVTKPKSIKKSKIDIPIQKKTPKKCTTHDVFALREVKKG